MYLRETVTGPFKDAATVSVKLAMVIGVIVSYVVGGLLGNPMLGEEEKVAQDKRRYIHRSIIVDSIHDVRIHEVHS